MAELAQSAMLLSPIMGASGDIDNGVRGGDLAIKIHICYECFIRTIHYIDTGEGDR